MDAQAHELTQRAIATKSYRITLALEGGARLGKVHAQRKRRPVTIGVASSYRVLKSNHTSLSLSLARAGCEVAQTDIAVSSSV